MKMAGVKGKSGRKSDAYIRKYGTEKVGTTKAGRMARVAENMMAARTAIEPALLIRKLNGIALTSLDLAQSGEKATTAQIAALRLASSIYQGLLNKVVSDVRALEVVDSTQQDAINGVLLMPSLTGGQMTSDQANESESASNTGADADALPDDEGA
jgi:hypothetical protein